MARYKHLSVRTIALSELKPPPRKQKELTPRQRERMERDDEIRAAINEAAAAPSSDAVVIDLKANQKLLTIRAAVTRILREEPRDINFGVRGGRLVFSKGSIPGGRGGGRRAGGARRGRRKAAASA